MLEKHCLEDFKRKEVKNMGEKKDLDSILRF